MYGVAQYRPACCSERQCAQQRAVLHLKWRARAALMRAMSCSVYDRSTSIMRGMSDTGSRTANSSYGRKSYISTSEAVKAREAAARHGRRARSRRGTELRPPVHTSGSCTCLLPHVAHKDEPLPSPPHRYTPHLLAKPSAAHCGPKSPVWSSSPNPRRSPQRAGTRSPGAVRHTCAGTGSWQAPPSRLVHAARIVPCTHATERRTRTQAVGQRHAHVQVDSRAPSQLPRRC